MYKTGDIILVGGNGWLARQIQRFTKSKYSHIGIIWEAYGKLFVIEQDTTGYKSAGLICTPIEHYLNSGEHVRILIRRNKGRIDGDGIKFSELFLSHLGRWRYSYTDLLFYQPLFQITGRWFGDKDVLNGRTICSVYVSYIYNTIYGYYSKNWYEKAPGDFEKDNYFYDIFKK